MFNSSKERDIKNNGNYNINNTGDRAHVGDVYNYYAPPKSLNRSYLYVFCEKFAEVEVNEIYSTEFATGIQQKIDHNEIEVYKDIFLDCENYLDDIEDVLQEIPKRSKILMFIHNKYRKIKQFNSEKNKDNLCEMVYKELLRTILQDGGSGNLNVEDAEHALHSIMYYAFVKCKLLDPIS